MRYHPYIIILLVHHKSNERSLTDYIIIFSKEKKYKLDFSLNSKKTIGIKADCFYHHIMVENARTVRNATKTPEKINNCGASCPL